jgi:mono/diheme cytochrome c family protein
MRHAFFALIIVNFALAGCERAMHDMYSQPRYQTQEPDPLFSDGSSARTPPIGTMIARAGPFADSSGGRVATTPAPDVAPVVMPILNEPANDGAIPTDIPVQVNAVMLARGRERFEIHCSPCHGYDGRGDGMIVRRGFPAPPSYHTPRLRQAPSLHFYQVITHGYGAMYSYAARVKPEDRWAIVAYVRALQLSEHAPIDALSLEEQRLLDGRNEDRGARSEEKTEWPTSSSKIAPRSSNLPP